MNLATITSFSDEIQKIAGELQGYVRSGRRPFHVDTLLEREKEQKRDTFSNRRGDQASAVLDKADDDTPKQANAKTPLSSQLKRVGGTMLAGGVLTQAAIQANRDRKLGKQVRQQQQGY